MADLAHGEAKGCEPVLLAQHAGDLGLHGGKLALGGADLVAPPRRRDDARRILRPFAETHHVPGELGHGLDQKHVEREVDERRGDDRDQDREPENIEAVADHRRFERSLLHHHLDELSGGEVRLADDADHPIGRLGVDHERVGDQSEPGGVAEIVGGIDLGRHVLLEDQPARVGPLHGHGLHLDALQKLIAQGLGQLAARCCFGGKGRDLRILEPGHQPLAAEVRHRGHEDEHLGHHDENDGQQQQLAGKPGPIADGLVLSLPALSTSSLT